MTIKTRKVTWNFQRLGFGGDGADAVVIYARLAVDAPYFFNASNTKSSPR